MRTRAAAVFLVVGLLLPAAAGTGPPGAGEALPLYRTLDEVPRRPELPVVLVFFSTGCSACWDDLFAVRLLVEESRFDCELIGVTRDPERSVRAFLDKYGYAGPVVRDAGKRLFRTLRVEVEPAAVVIEDGRVVYRDDAYRTYASRREELKKWMMRRGGASISG